MAAQVSTSFVYFLLSIISIFSLFHGVHAQRKSCPVDTFCPIDVNCTSNTTACVTVCPTERDPMQQGNWTSGNCERVIDGTHYWMDSTFYEIFILTNQTINIAIREIQFISSERFKTNDLTYKDLVEDITFTLNGSCPYFYLTNMSKSDTTFENYYDYYVPDTIEMTTLTLAESVPPDDYEMQIFVTDNGTILEIRDIVIHVTRDPRCLDPPCPLQDTSVAFTSSNFIVSESDGSLVVTVVSSGKLQSQSFTIYVIVEANDFTFAATNGADFIAGRYNATFTPGATTATTSIPITADSIYEPNAENFNLRLYIDGAGYQLGLYKGDISKATVSIVEATTVRFSQSIYTVNESNGLVRFMLFLSNPLTNVNVTLNVSEISVTATRGGVDYISGPYSVVFLAGMTNTSFDIQIRDDEISEKNESFTLDIINSSLPTGITVSSPSQATVIIENDDIVVIEFTSGQFVGSESSRFIEVMVGITGGILSAPINITLTPSVQSPLSASGRDFNANPFNITINPGDNDVRANISVICDSTVERSETFDIRLTLTDNISGVELHRKMSEGLITDNTVVVNFNQSTYGVMEGDGIVSIVILLSQPSTVPFQVVINTFNVNAEDAKDFTGGRRIVTVSDGVLSHTLRMNIIEDNIVECGEKFNVTIASDSDLSCGVTIGTNANSEVMITDNDRAVVSIGQTQYTIAESNNTLAVFVTLSAVTSKDVIVGINISDISTTVGLDYELGFPSVFNATIPAGMTSLSASVDIINDMIQEDNETASGVITLFSTCLSLSLGTSSAMATIIDDDVAVIQFTSLEFSGLESSEILSITIMIADGIVSSRNITTQITFASVTASGNNIDYNSTTQTVTIIAGTNNSTVNITVTDDNIVEGNETFSMFLTLPSSLGPRIMTGDITSATGIIIDTSDATISFIQSSYTITEGSKSLKPSLILSNPSSTNVTIEVMNTDGTATGGNDYSNGPYMVIFPARITNALFEVSIIDDNVLENRERFSLFIMPNSLPDRVARENPHTSTVYIVDNDTLTVQFSSPIYADIESSGSISVALILGGGVSSTDISVVVIPFDQSPLSAEGGNDYDSTPITASFTAGTTSTMINVPITNDTNAEEIETFNLNIIIPSSLLGRLFLGERAMAVGKIIDASRLIVELASSEFIGNESSGSVNVLITKSNALSNATISVMITLTEQSPISATGSGIDFDSSSLTITFNPEETVKTVRIPVMCDKLIEGMEMFNINLNLISVSHNITVDLGLNRSIGVINDSTVAIKFAQSTYIIREDAVSLMPVITLNQASPMLLKLSVNLIDVSTTEEDYDQRSILVTIAPGTTTQQFTVNVTNDNIIECNEMFNLSISAEETTCSLNTSNSNAQVAIVNDDVGTLNIMLDRQPSLSVVESAGSLIINVLLNATASKGITLLTNLTDVTASAESDYSQTGISSVNIISGSMSGSMSINIIDNTIQEPNETFNVSFHLQDSCLPISIIGNNSFTITIIDDEELMVEFNKAIYNGTETSGVIVVILNLLGGTSSINFNVTLSTLPVTATGDVDYVSAPLTATFVAGSTSATVEILIVNDTVVNEEDEAFNVTLKLLPAIGVRVMPGIHSTATAVIIDTTPPQIYVHPLDKTIKINNDSTSVEFNCMAYGASSYFWLRETGDIPPDAVGIKSNTLTLHNILPINNGRYQCVAKNKHGKNYSNYALLTVEVLPPVVNIAPEKQLEVKEGERVEFNCSATGVGANNFIYQWTLNGLTVAGQNKPTLVIDTVSKDNTGEYKCFVKNLHKGIGKSKGVKLIILDQLCNPVTVNYTRFNVTWNETLVGVTVEAPCTGHGLNGTVRRRCIGDNEWEEFFECVREETAMLLNEAKNLSSLNETEKIAKTSDIAHALVNVTASTQEPIFAEDINLAVNIVTTLNNVTETIIANLTADNTFFEDTTSVIDNLLSDANRDSWKQLERTSPSTSQDLVNGAEQVTKLLSETLTNDATEAIKIKPNIVIKAERVSNDSVDKGYIFPDKNDNLSTYAGGNAQLMVPAGLLQDINAGSKEFTIASTVIRNGSGLRLPSSSNGTAAPQFPASAIFSLQINPYPDPNTLARNPIMMMFDVDPTAALSEQSDVQKQDFTINDIDASCNFYDYTLVTNNNLNQIGGWSTEGLTVDKNHSTKTSVACLTNHLTSFAVLVSIQDERPPSTADKALSIISYVGCSISLACLCISIIFLSYAIYKTKDKKHNLFIHLNLCIALALGLVVFITGIENATSNEAGCKLVAALLQYLFISAFCWMLCEGVILYMMLVTVFGNKLNKRRFFFILGWGPAIPIVAISTGIVHEHYGTDHYCWIKSDDGAIAAFIIPIVAIMLINFIFVVITLKVLWANRQTTKNEEIACNKDAVKDLLKALIVLLPLLGLTWIIGIFAVNNETQVFAWIFAILNSLQGFFIFVFHVIRNKQVIREMRERYTLVKRSEAFRRLISVRGTTTTSIFKNSSKARSSQSTSSEVSGRSKKISTTSFGSTTNGGDYLSTTLERTLKDKPDLFEDSVFVEENDQMKLTTFKKLEESITVEEHDAGVDDKQPVKEHYEENSVTEKDNVAIVAGKNNTTTSVKEKPAILPRITK